ncbi:MAG: FtsQ-type POTRA domain-containing protein [Pyrinomonadaceae bacterium]|nr:FtsQ-type POTRA domain-containing protein [Pyrinomonadaceae bacterium]
MARKRRTTTRSKTRTAAKRRRPGTRRKKKSMANFFVPLFFIFCILSCLGLVTLVGYRTVTASSFFDFQAVAVRGVSRAPRAKIEKIVRTNTVKTGVWYADIDLIKREVEKFRYVKSASVSRVLPNKIRVVVNERIPKAVVRIEGGDYWVDKDALVLSRVSNGERRPKFTMFGWDQSESPDAIKLNKKRVELFVSLRKEWQKFDLVSRVRAIDLSDLREPRAIVSDSGENVTIFLGRKDFGKSLKEGLENIAGRGKDVESIIISGSRNVIGYRNS